MSMREHNVTRAVAFLAASIAATVPFSKIACLVLALIWYISAGSRGQQE